MAVLDDFNRANGSLGSNWVDSPSLSGGTFGIVSNKVQATGAVWRMAYWNPSTNTFNTDHYSEVVCSVDFAGPVVRHSTSGTSTGYWLFRNGTQILLYKFNGTTFTQLRTSGAVAPSGGNVTLRLEVIGTTLTAFVDGVAPPGFAINDSTYTTGQPGVAANNGTLDDFAASPETVTVPQVLPLMLLMRLYGGSDITAPSMPSNVVGTQTP